jgi:uncharacterized protein YegP (UPF0339 family)
VNGIRFVIASLGAHHRNSLIAAIQVIKKNSAIQNNPGTPNKKKTPGDK